LAACTSGKCRCGVEVSRFKVCAPRVLLVTYAREEKESVLMCPGDVCWGCVIAGKTMVLGVFLARFCSRRGSRRVVPEPVLTNPRASCRPWWSSGRLSRRSAICWSRHWFSVGDVTGSLRRLPDGCQRHSPLLLMVALRSVVRRKAWWQLSGILPGTHARKDEDRLLLEFPYNPTRTHSV
jgi:hypothetical protein